MSEAMSPAADPNSRDRQYHYEATFPPPVDYAAKAIADAQDRYRDAYPDANMNGLMWGARKVDDRPGHAAG